MSAEVQTVPKVDNLIDKNTPSHRKSDKMQSRRAAIINSANNTCCVLTGENISVGGGGTGAGGGGGGGGGNNISTTAQQHKKNKHESEMRHFKSSRKRLQSFNGNSGKFFPPYKRRKKEGVIVPPTKFLLGGNICDPLNLNSLQDEEVNRAMNAVTPKSSPLPTPRHRKGQIEVIIPPNIYDPLNLAAGDDDAAYEAMLISPVKRSQKKQKKNKKRKHSKSISGPGSGKEDTADEARFSGDERKSGESEELCTSQESIKDPKETSLTESQEDENISKVQKEDKIDDKTNEQEIQEKTPLITSTEDSAEPEIASAISSSATVVTPGELQTLTTNPSGPAILTTEDAAIPTQSADFESNKISLKSELNLALESSYPNTSKISQSVSAVTSSVPSIKDNQDNTSNIINVITTSINPSSTTSTAAANVSVNLKKIRKELKDKIVSPVIPQPGAWGDPRNHWYRSQPQRLTPQINKGQATPKFKENNTRFQYGNYNRYYGYRNANEDCDVRLKVLARRKDLFEGKDVLDIGCNVGHITLAIARDFHPNKIVGVDIDRALIGAAKRNIRHYLNPRDKNYPISMPILYGPINVPLTSKSDDCFPHNISFIQGNYVLESDVLLTMEQPQFDTILCLSITKWFHLNWGDEGLKRAFKRMYSQLRPGGVLILEPQPWHSYKKKRNLTAQIWRNYQNIELFPHKFSQFLLSEVGFTKCEVIGAPLHPSRGFQRPIKLFTKGETIFNSNPPSSRIENEIGIKPSTVTSSAIINLNKNDKPILETVTEVDESDDFISDDRQFVRNMEIVTEETGDKIESSSDINIVNRTPSSAIDEKTDKQCDNLSNKIIDCNNENCEKRSVAECGIPSNNDLSSDIGNDKR